jgi:hypothetical protein
VNSPGYPVPNEFFMAWQHGAVLVGYLGAYLAWGEPILLEIAEDVPTAIDYSWVTNYVGHPIFGNFPVGIRHYTHVSANNVPVAADHFDATIGGRFGDSPIPGSATICIAGLYLLAELTANGAVADMAEDYALQLLGGSLVTFDRTDEWNYCIPASAFGPVEGITGGAEFDLADVSTSLAGSLGISGEAGIQLGAAFSHESTGVTNPNTAILVGSTGGGHTLPRTLNQFRVLRYRLKKRRETQRKRSRR